VFGKERTEQRGPIRRYKKVRPESKKPARRPQRVVSNTDTGIGTEPPVTSPTEPVSGMPTLPPSTPLRTWPVTFTPRDTSRLRRLVIVGVFVVFIAGIAIPLISVGNTIRSINHEVFPNVSPTPGVPQPSQPRTSTPAKHASYLTAAGARAGLAQIARLAPGARVSLLRIAAASISVIAQLPNGTSKLISLLPNGRFTSTTPSAGQRPIPIKKIKPSVVASLVSEMKARFHVPAARIDYMVLNSAPGLPVHWVLFTKAPVHGFSAGLQGAHLARLPGS
jgi:hypothetical protein